MIKKKTISQLRKIADKEWSRYVRMRDADAYGMVTCITCPVRKHYKEMHAGHFQSRRFPATRWDEENVNAQCAGCNMFNSGEQYKYSLAVDLKYGAGTAKRLALKSQGYFKVTRQFLEEVIDTTKEADA